MTGRSVTVSYTHLVFLYEIRLLQPGGSLVKLKIDARDGTVLGMKGRDIQFRNRH